MWLAKRIFHKQEIDKYFPIYITGRMIIIAQNIVSVFTWYNCVFLETFILALFIQNCTYISLFRPLCFTWMYAIYESIHHAKMLFVWFVNMLLCIGITELNGLSLMT